MKWKLILEIPSEARTFFNMIILFESLKKLFDLLLSWEFVSNKKKRRNLKFFNIEKYVETI